jgi:hypothetical protein
MANTIGSFLDIMGERNLTVLNELRISSNFSITSSIVGRFVGFSFVIASISSLMNSKPLYFYTIPSAREERKTSVVLPVKNVRERGCQGNRYPFEMDCTALRAYVRVQTYHRRVAVSPTHFVRSTGETGQSRSSNSEEVALYGCTVWLVP